MKNITIKARQIRSEIITLFFCFLISFFSNVGAVIYYKSPVSELFTSLHYVLIFTVFLYVIWGIIRVLKSAILKVISRK